MHVLLKCCCNAKRCQNVPQSDCVSLGWPQWLSSLPREPHLRYESADEFIRLEQLCSHGALRQISDSVVGHLQAGSVSCCDLHIKAVACSKQPALQLEPAATDTAVWLCTGQPATCWRIWPDEAPSKMVNDVPTF